MTQAIYDPIGPAAPRNAGSTNDIYTALATASASLTAVNFAAEGMDHRPFEAHPVGFRTGRIMETVRPAGSLAVSVPFIQFVQNGTVFRLNSPGSVPSSLTGNELLRIRARVWFETTLANGRGINGVTQLRLAWNDGTTTAQVLYSVRTIAQGPAGAGCDGVLFCEGWLHGPIANIAWAELQFTNSNIAHPSASMLWATLFRRQNEV